MEVSEQKKAALMAKFGLKPPVKPQEAPAPTRYSGKKMPTCTDKSVWQLLPGEGIGPLHLGMTSGQLEDALHQARHAWGVTSLLEELTDLSLPGAAGVAVRYLDDVLFVRVQYVEDRATEITVDRMTAERVEILWNNTPVFGGASGELARQLDLAKGDLGYAQPGLLLWQEGFRENEPFDFAIVRCCAEKGE